jgi:hypothetical protein
MKKELLSSWFAKESWSVDDAALLLYGCNPSMWDRYVPKEEYLEADDTSIHFWHASPTRFESLLHDLRCDLVAEVSESRGGEGDPLIPVRVAQWAYDVKNRFWFDEEFLAYIQNPANKISCQDNSWIDRGYSEWAKLDFWTLEEAADLLSGCQVGRGYEIRSRHPNKLRDELIFTLTRSSMCVTREGTKVVESRKVIDWAISKEIAVPPMLVTKIRGEKIRGEKTHNNNSPNLQKQQCKKWFQGVFNAGVKEKTKGEYRKEALSKFLGLAGRSFDAVWDEVTKGSDWQKTRTPKLK